jgi:hypothetical protein
MRLAVLIASFSAAIVMAAASASSAGSTALSASEILGCCVCRGTEGGDATAVRSCSDGVKVDTCVSQCKVQNADSIAFGYKQTCSQGCAGFPTQSLH